MFRKVKSSFETSFKNFKKSGTNANVFWDFCQGTVNILYMREWTLTQPNILNMVVTSIPKKHSIITNVKNEHELLEPSPAKKKVKFETPTSSMDKYIEYKIERDKAKKQKKKKKKKHRKNKHHKNENNVDDKIDKLKKAYFEDLANYNAQRETFIAFVRKHYTQYDGKALLLCDRDDLVTMLDNNPRHALIEDVDEVQMCKQIMLESKSNYTHAYNALLEETRIPFQSDDSSSSDSSTSSSDKKIAAK
jgi:hypothetical protein